MKNKCNTTSTCSSNSNVNWYRNNHENPKSFSMIDKTLPTSKVSEHDVKLMEFIKLCESLESTINELTKLRDSPRINDEYWKFRSKVVEIKNSAIVESYGRNCFTWKFIGDE